MSRDDHPSDDDPTIQRRNLLRALAAGSTIPLASEPALGRPPWAGGPPDDGNGNGGPPENSPQEYEGCACGAGEWLAKYEERGGELEFEEGTDLGDVEVTEIKEGDEITGFNFYTDRADLELCVKHGPKLTSFDGEDRTDNGSGFAYCYEVEIEEYAVSNFVVCPLECVYYQIDFVTGEPIETDCCTIESYGGRVLASAFGNTCDGGITRRVSGSDLGQSYDDCFEIPFDGGSSADDNPDRIAEITLEDGEAEASFEPVSCSDPPEQVSLVIYEVTEPPYETDNQVLLDSEEREWDDLDLGEENDLRVDLPADGSA